MGKCTKVVPPPVSVAQRVRAIRKKVQARVTDAELTAAVKKAMRNGTIPEGEAGAMTSAAWLEFLGRFGTETEIEVAEPALELEESIAEGHRRTARQTCVAHVPCFDSFEEACTSPRFCCCGLFRVQGSKQLYSWGNRLLIAHPVPGDAREDFHYTKQRPPAHFH